jgi:hypothetical protein
MIKAQAWPYPVFEELECGPPTANCDGVELQIRPAAKGWVVAGGLLRDRSSGRINLTI